jgi:hypothetical protein
MGGGGAGGEKKKKEEEITRLPRRGQCGRAPAGCARASRCAVLRAASAVLSSTLAMPS